jgi:apolipoprotein N-acyltransferase
MTKPALGNILSTLARPQRAYLRFIYITLSGLLSGVCVVFPSTLSAIIEWLAFIPAALAIFSACEHKNKLSYGFFCGFWLVFTQNLVAYHWFFSFHSSLVISGLDDVGATLVTFLAWIGLPLITAVGGGIFGLFLFLFVRMSVVKNHPSLIPPLSAAGYALLEWARTFFWFGVPWSRLSLGQLTDGPSYTLLTNSVLGTYFVTFLIVLVSFLFAQGIYLGKLKARSIIALALVAANLGAGLVIANIPTQTKASVKVAAIQGNVSSAEKWGGDNGESILDRYCRLTEEAAEEGATLIVWPETAIPYVVLEDSLTQEKLSEMCKKWNITLLFGCFALNENEENMSALRTMYPDGTVNETFYAKRRLVPFGEYVPMRDVVMTVLPILAEINMLSNDLAPGSDSELMDVNIDGETFKAGGIICFDSIYESISYDAAFDGADILCISTNDSWFFDSKALDMHFSQGRLRAIETGLPVICAANTGISAIITKYGKVQNKTAPLCEAYSISEIEISDSRAVACYTSNIFIYLCIAFFCAIASAELAVRVYDNRKKKSNKS